MELIRTVTSETVRLEVRRIMLSGILEDGLFLLREGNSPAQYTPLGNIEVMYHASKEFGDFKGAFYILPQRQK